MNGILKNIVTAMVFFGLWAGVSACSAVDDGTGGGSGGADSGGTETGTSDAGNSLDTSELGARIEGAASALVPEMSADDAAASRVAFLVDGTAEEWETYLDPNNVTVLTDIFGPADEDPRVVTKIRVLLEDFRSSVDDIFSGDPDISCGGGAETDSVAVLDAGDEVNLAFYGALPNGDAEDRYYDCVQTYSGNGDEAVRFYGVDDASVVRIVDMSSMSYANTTDVDIRGDEAANLAVVHSAYAEETGEDGATTVFLDIQYAQASVYEGADGTIGTEDDVVFKSRSRITGEADLSNDGEIARGRGEFSVIKYDRGVDEDGITSFETATQTMGRGDYSAGGFSLFRIASTMSSVDDLARTFCIGMPEEEIALPESADAADCSAYEEDFSWGEDLFPFDLDPAQDAVFDANAFFEADDTDMIADDGSNFEIPHYETAE